MSTHLSKLKRKLFSRYWAEKSFTAHAHSFQRQRERERERVELEIFMCCLNFYPTPLATASWSKEVANRKPFHSMAFVNWRPLAHSVYIRPSSFTVLNPVFRVFDYCFDGPIAVAVICPKTFTRPCQVIEEKKHDKCCFIERKHSKNRGLNEPFFYYSVEDEWKKHTII